MSPDQSLYAGCSAQGKISSLMHRRRGGRRRTAAASCSMRRPPQPRAASTDSIPTKLRSKVTIEDLSECARGDGAMGCEATPKHGLCYRDPRLPTLGQRIILGGRARPKSPPNLAQSSFRRPRSRPTASLSAYPAAELDFAYGDAFPHEAVMDQLHGVDFKKGCFVGQEVVTRMERRGTARTRIVPVAFDGRRTGDWHGGDRGREGGGDLRICRGRRGSRCCGSTAPRMPWPRARHWWQAPRPCASSSRCGRSFHFPAKQNRPDAAFAFHRGAFHCRGLFRL